MIFSVQQKLSPPHTGTRVADIMQWVLLATLPGVLAQTYFFGWRTLLNVGLCAASCVAFEALALRWRGRDVRAGIADYSALVTAVLLSVALPTLAPWWLAVIGSAFAILLAKHAYGGLGQNIFNPAMAAFALLLVSFPEAMSQWPAPRGTPVVDGTTMATALHVIRENHSQLVSDMWGRDPQMGSWSGRGWEWVNLSFLAGGLFLLRQKFFTWHAPIAFLATLAVCAAAFYDHGSSASAGSPVFHLLGGATMIGAFFILTDPVTTPTTPRGKLLAGILAGGLTFLLRRASNYPDGVAFAILLINVVAPLFDRYTQPRIFGRAKKSAAPNEAP